MPFLPRQAAVSCLRRARRLLNLANNKLPVARIKNDLRRMALVMAVAAIDSYMHAVVLRRVSAVRKREDLPKALSRLEIPFSEIADLADTSIAAQRDERSCRPWVRVKASLQARLLKVTFQSFDQVAVGFAMAGIDQAWSKIASELGESTGIIKDWLNDVVHRRNQIVHEGDMKRAARPRRLQFNDIDHFDVEYDVQEVELLIDAMDMVVSKNP